MQCSVRQHEKQPDQQTYSRLYISPIKKSSYKTISQLNYLLDRVTFISNYIIMQDVTNHKLTLTEIYASARIRLQGKKST